MFCVFYVFACITVTPPANALVPEKDALRSTFSGRYLWLTVDVHHSHIINTSLTHH